MSSLKRERSRHNSEISMSEASIVNIYSHKERLNQIYDFVNGRPGCRFYKVAPLQWITQKNLDSMIEGRRSTILYAYILSHSVRSGLIFLGAISMSEQKGMYLCTYKILLSTVFVLIIEQHAIAKSIWCHNYNSFKDSLTRALLPRHHNNVCSL